MNHVIFIPFKFSCRKTLFYMLNQQVLMTPYYCLQKITLRYTLVWQDNYFGRIARFGNLGNFYYKLYQRFLWILNLHGI
jgi:hypothetical protein